MIRILITVIIISAGAGRCFAQASGNVGYSQSGSNAKARQNERNKRVVVQGEAPPTATSMFIEASVLMNAKADEYVAIFGIAQEGGTVAECNQKMDTVISEFSAELKQLGIGREDF